MSANATALLDRLVAFPTVSSVSNLDLLDWIEATFAGLSPRLRRFPNAEGDKANLLLSIGPDEPGGLLLSGHTDVVPAANQPWTGDPFTLRRDGGRLIGRGATDMKGFLACAMAAALAADAKTTEEAAASRLLLRRGGRLHRRRQHGRMGRPLRPRPQPRDHRRAVEAAR